MSSGKRYKFQGSTFAVQTGFGTPKTITSATKANPVVIGATSHGFSEGDAVKISSVSGMTELNGNLYAVDNPATSTFELALTDGTNYTTFVTGSPADGIAEPVTFSQFCELTGSNQQDASPSTIDVSTICSTAKEFESGLPDSGSLTLDYNWAGLETVQSAIRAAKFSGDQIAFRITMPGTGGHVLMFGVVQQESFQGAVDGVWKATATIKLSGPVFVLS